MLPEKRKNLIIGGIALVVLIIVIILIWAISSFIKNRYKENMGYSNDLYMDKYEYLAIVKDDEDINKVYGYNEVGRYLNVRSFYDVLDITWEDNKLRLFSDAVNELRYDSNKDTYYFYELDRFYSNSFDVLLSKDYIVISNGMSISYWDYGNRDGEMQITNKLVSNKVMVVDNIVYYYISDGIYQYDMDSKNNKRIVPVGENSKLELLNCDKYYLAFLSNGELFMYNIKLDVLVKVDKLKDFKYIDNTKDGFIYLENIDNKNILKYYSLEKNDIIDKKIFLGKEMIVSSKRLSDDTYFMILSSDNKNRSVIVSIEKEKVIREFDEDVMKLVKVEKDEN